jgi:hypothetical protein
MGYVREPAHAPASRRSRLTLVHPWLLASAAPLALLAQNPAGVLWWEPAAAVGGALLLAGALYLLARRLYSSPPAAALATSWAMLMLFGYGLLLSLAGALSDWGSPISLSSRTVLPLWGALLVFGLWWIGRRGFDVHTVGLCACVFGLFAVAGPLALVAMHTGGDPQALLPSPVNLGSEEPIRLARGADPPDVYYLVVSGYADEATLREKFFCDNRAFLQGLKRRGFALADQSRANYPNPELQMAAALNMQYLGEAIGPKSQYQGLLAEHRVGRLLVEQGYRYYHLGGPVDGLRESPLANESYRFSLMPTAYTDRLISLTPLQPWLGDKDRRTQMLEKFDRLDMLAQRNGPKLVVAYLTALQPPWTFNHDGAPITSRMLHDQSQQESYKHQLRYVNFRLERAIDAILAFTKGNAVIVVQADEGPRLADDRAAPSDEMAKLRQRSGVLCAIYLPRGAAQGKVPAQLTPVNTFRLVFRECFGADVKRLADRSFYWRGSDAAGDPLFGRNLALVDVTEKLAGP